MDLFKFADELRYGNIHIHSNPDLGLHAIVALHNLTLGPAIGGTRFVEYEATDDALFDVMRLARGMTYKAAISNLNHGGGKAVIVRPKGLTEEQRTKIFKEFGQFVDSLGGQYYTCEDSGTNVSDMNIVKKETNYVLGYDPEAGSSGDPSPLTALGVRRGIEAAVKHKLDRIDLEGLRVAIQGVGHVGYYVAEELHDLGAKLIVTDVNQEAVDKCVDAFGAEVVTPDEIYGVDCDIFAPCALGAIINPETRPKLKCKIVAGAANNQLLTPEDGKKLAEMGILYAPDYAINAGGLINVATEFTGHYTMDAAQKQVLEVYDTMMTIFERAEKESELPEVIADRIVEEKIYK